LGKDLLGSVRSVTADGGALEDRYEYDAFGQPYAGDLDGMMNLGYTGKPYDAATGMYNYGYRDYKPETVRFTTVDPIRDGNNWYAYVNNDPVNWIDPLGLFIINNINGPSANDYQSENPGSIGRTLGVSGVAQTIQSNKSIGFPMPGTVTLPNRLNQSLKTAYDYQNDNNSSTRSIITSKATKLLSGNYEISITVTNYTINSDGGIISYNFPVSGIIAYAGPGEVGINGALTTVNPNAVIGIAIETISTVYGTKRNYSVQYSK
jgi:RHS repeat-associated protein